MELGNSIQEYCGVSDADWCQPQPLAAFPPFPFWSPPPLLLSDDSGFVIADGLGGPGDCSSDLILREEEITGYLPMIPAQAAADDHYDPFAMLPPLRSAGLDDALLLQPLSDIDLMAFDDVFADEQKAVPLIETAIVPVGDHHPFGAHHEQARPTEDVKQQPQQNAARGGNGLDRRVGSIVVAKPCHKKKATPAARRVKRSSDRSAAVAGSRSLEHIEFEDLRKYFYMPITKAAREMNVGLTVLKKRCRELGVARWPHRKMKSLRSLILNFQEMGKGMEPAAVQQQLEALETYCALMEEDPSIELSERTKKLRQACFKENYKRRRAAAVNVLDHCCNLGH